ncbi:hypothetical protein C8R45DRAFT_1101000 [Mycena sanguinolenta]|nr:hypothetical protein C8R45DRAFT_1101000 [Mycena sanguinolenta]
MHSPGCLPLKWTLRLLVSAPLAPPAYTCRDIVHVGYVSPSTNAFAVRMFYQATNGTILAAYHSGVPGLGTPLSAFQSNLNGVLPEVIVIQYLDENRLLTQRFTTADDNPAHWSAPVTITT